MDNRYLIAAGKVEKALATELPLHFSVPYRLVSSAPLFKLSRLCYYITETHDGLARCITPLQALQSLPKSLS